ncbi:MAG: ABC transporter ATP-binding protein [Anaerococcus prevotii]|uniref:ABC transporter ATP-binding protein n=1 Tax=Anaerococcus prevotii TaxID=33034 RepID=UPI0028FE3185|nr:ABC transporter ATP-binding protein [Anaerococcus prevotii]MDU2558702.1 ABC transporter ATP-binding protein [Anaerococcus prevotii]
MIEAKNLTISYDKKVIDNISFKIEEGKVNILMGRNGSGKSTILNAISGIKSYEGEIKTDGKVSYLNQNINSKAKFTVFETILLGKVADLSLRITKDDKRDVEKILDLLDIRKYKDKYINRLSGGEVQKVFIGQALVANPKILLLDEPVSALDLKNQYDIMRIIKDLTEKLNLTTLISLHQIALIEKFADNIILIDNNKIYRQGPSKEVMDEVMFRDIFEMETDIRDFDGNRHIYFK